MLVGWSSVLVWVVETGCGYSCWTVDIFVLSMTAILLKVQAREMAVR